MSQSVVSLKANTWIMMVTIMVVVVVTTMHITHRATMNSSKKAREKSSNTHARTLPA
jgi:hypothetical protein